MYAFPADRVERDPFSVQIEENEPIPLERCSQVRDVSPAPRRPPHQDIHSPATDCPHEKHARQDFGLLPFPISPPASFLHKIHVWKPQCPFQSNRSAEMCISMRMRFVGVGGVRTGVPRP